MKETDRAANILVGRKQRDAITGKDKKLPSSMPLPADQLPSICPLLPQLSHSLIIYFSDVLISGVVDLVIRVLTM